MCGIFGFVAKRKIIGNNQLLQFKESLKSLQHRGPDGMAFWNDGQCFLGFTHLSFFDEPSASAIQPLHNETNTVHTVCNGEIYNYIELQKDLSGHFFSSKSDCEVITHLYEEYGKSFPKLIKGQFALILWDSVGKTIILARDRFGICPLFYFESKEGIYFSSEIKVLLPYLPKKLIDIGAIAQLTCFYGPDHEKTCFKEVRQVPPANYIKINLQYESTKSTDVKYWKLEFSDKIQYEKAKQKEIQSKFEFLLNKSIKKRLHGNFVPGVYLSGGIDSDRSPVYWT